MRVKALTLGYYGHQRRRKGSIFDLLNEADFSKRWMEKVGNKEALHNSPPSAGDHDDTRPKRITDQVEHETEDQREPVALSDAMPKATKEAGKPDPTKKKAPKKKDEGVI